MPPGSLEPPEPFSLQAQQGPGSPTKPDPNSGVILAPRGGRPQPRQPVSSRIPSAASGGGAGREGLSPRSSYDAESSYGDPNGGRDAAMGYAAAPPPQQQARSLPITLRQPVALVSPQPAPFSCHPTH